MSKRLTKEEVENFEKKVIDFLKSNQAGQLHSHSDFFLLCNNLLKIDNKLSVAKTNRIIRDKLNKMVEKKMIIKERRGTGFMGVADFGVKSMNIYLLADFYDKD